MLQSSAQPATTLTRADGAERRSTTADAPAAKTGDNSSTTSEAFLERYLKRIDPTVAQSFTPEQRTAIAQLLGSRGVANHSIELRKVFPLGKRRFYLVFLMGRDQRRLTRMSSLERAHPLYETLQRLVTVAMWIFPGLALALALGMLLGIDFAPNR